MVPQVEGMPHSQRGIKHYAWHGIRQACMWRDDGTRSAVKQSYRRVTVLVHGTPSLLSFLSPSCRATGAGMDGRGGAWEVVPARPCSCSPCSVVNLLFYVLGAILIKNYIMHVPEEELVTKIPETFYLMNVPHGGRVPRDGEESCIHHARKSGS